MINSMIDWWEALTLVPQLMIVFGFTFAVMVIDRILVWISSGVRSCVDQPSVSLHELRDW